jgi:glycosyltransferase involved in cell wall biosynthesis
VTKKKPKLSVIIASVNGPEILKECLKNLNLQSMAAELEVIVASRCANLGVKTLDKKYSTVKFIQAGPKTTLPQLRALALQETTGDVIGVLEDHCMVEADWAQRMFKAHQSEYPVIGGSVENAACARTIDWAAYFCEYSQAMNPIPEGEVGAIPGNNVSYKRPVFERFQEDMEQGAWDFIVHDRMRKAQIALYSIPAITVHHKMSSSLGWFIKQKFHIARSFAGMRFASSSRFRRARYALGTILLPLILANRIVSCVWKKRRHRLELILSFPYLFLLLLTWGFGEAVGYIFGPGSSPQKVS